MAAMNKREVEIARFKNTVEVNHAAEHKLVGEVMPLGLAQLVVSFCWDVPQGNTQLVTPRREFSKKCAVEVAYHFRR